MSPKQQGIQEAAQALAGTLVEAMADRFWDDVELASLLSIAGAGLRVENLSREERRLLKLGIIAGGHAALTLGLEQGVVRRP